MSEWAYIAHRLKERVGARAGEWTWTEADGRTADTSGREGGTEIGCLQVLNLRLDQRNFGLAPFVSPFLFPFLRMRASCAMPVGYHDALGERQNVTMSHLLFINT